MRLFFRWSHFLQRISVVEAVKRYAFFSNEIYPISSWPCRKAQAGLSSKPPSFLPVGHTAIAVLRNAIFPMLQFFWMVQSCPRAVRELVLHGFAGEKVDYVSVFDVFWRLIFDASCCFSMRATCCFLLPCNARRQIPQTRTSNFEEKVTKGTSLAEDSAVSLGQEDKGGRRGQSVRTGRQRNPRFGLVPPKTEN